MSASIAQQAGRFCLNVHSRHIANTFQKSNGSQELLRCNMHTTSDKNIQTDNANDRNEISILMLTLEEDIFCEGKILQEGT